MSTDLRKFLCLIGVSLGVFLTTNGQVEAAKSICTKTELYIKRGSVKYAIKESKKPGRETCGLLIIEKFYPKKLPRKKALTLVKNARDFLSRTSPKYSTLLKYVIKLDAEPKKLTENINELKRYPKDFEPIKILEKKNEGILSDFVKKPGGACPKKLLSAGWGEYLKLYHCVNEICETVKDLKKVVPVNQTRPPKPSRLSEKEVDRAITLLEKLDAKYKGRDCKIRGKPKVPQISIRGWLKSGKEYQNCANAYKKVKNLQHKKLKLTCAKKAAKNMGGYDPRNLQKESVSQSSMEAQRLVDKFKKSPRKFQNKRSLGKIKLLLKKSLPKFAEKPLLLAMEKYNGCFVGRLPECGKAINIPTKFPKKIRRKVITDLSKNGYKLSKSQLDSMWSFLFRSKDLKKIKTKIKKIENLYNKEFFKYEKQRPLLPRIEIAIIYKNNFQALVSHQLMVNAGERYQIANRFFKNHRQILQKELIPRKYLKLLKDKLKNKTTILPTAESTTAWQNFQDYYKELCRPYIFGTPHYIWLNKRKHSDYRINKKKFRDDFNERLRKVLAIMPDEHDVDIRLPQLKELNCSRDNFKINNPKLFDLYLRAGKLLEIKKEVPEHRKLVAIRQKHDRTGKVITDGYLRNLKTLELRKKRGGADPSAVERNNENNHQDKLATFFIKERCKAVKEAFRPPRIETCTFAGELEMKGDWHLHKFLKNQQKNKDDLEFSSYYYEETKTLAEAHLWKEADNDNDETHFYQSPSLEMKLRRTQKARDCDNPQGDHKLTCEKQNENYFLKLQGHLSSELGGLIKTREKNQMACGMECEELIKFQNNQPNLLPLSPNLELLKILRPPRQAPEKIVLPRPQFSKGKRPAIAQFLEKRGSAVTSVRGNNLPTCPSDQTQRYHNCFGTYTYDTGDKYVGEFKDGNYHGQGTYTFANGDEYVGEFKDGNYHGQGTYTFADGDKYFGEYRHGKRQGQGTLYAADGAVKKQGIWKDDKFLSAPKAKQGVVSKKTSPGAAPVLLKCNKSSPKWHNCDGSKKWGKGTYYGRFMNNKPHGRGTITNTDKWQYVGQFRNGKKHGPGLLIDPDGGEYPERYINGKKLLH